MAELETTAVATDGTPIVVLKVIEVQRRHPHGKAPGKYLWAHK